MDKRVYLREGYTLPSVPGQGPTGPRRGLDLTAPGSGTLKPTVTIGHHRTSPDQSIAIGVATSPKRANGGRGPRPFTGKGEGQRPEVSASMYLHEAVGLASGRPGREIRLVQHAADVLAGDVREPGTANLRKHCKAECEALAEFPQAERLSEAVSRALGF